MENVFLNFAGVHQHHHQHQFDHRIVGLINGNYQQMRWHILHMIMQSFIKRIWERDDQIDQFIFLIGIECPIIW